MATLLLTHPSFIKHDTGPGHPERPDRMRAIDKVLAHEVFRNLNREEAPLREDVREHIERVHPVARRDERIRQGLEHRATLEEAAENRRKLQWLVALHAVSGAVDDHDPRRGIAARELRDVVVVDHR